MHFSTLTTLSLFVGASLATVISLPQDIAERDIIERAIAAGPHPNGACGSKAGHACHGSQFGLCCSKDGECGASDGHCGGGCQGSYGHCGGHGDKPGGHPGGKPGGHPGGHPEGKPGGHHIIVPYPGKTTYGPVIPTSQAYALSTNGRCGLSYRSFCNGSRWGNCCSEDGYCGSTDSFCGTGCQDDFGDCSLVGPIGGSSTPSSSMASSTMASSTSSSMMPSSTALPISRDGTCGKTRGFTCQGSTFGACCGANGFCGLGAACGTGCQSDAGVCAILPSSSMSSMVTSSSDPAVSASSASAVSASSASAVSASSASLASVSSASLASVSSASFASVSSVSLASVSSASAASASSASAVSASSASAASASRSSSMPSASPTPIANGTMIYVKRSLEKRAELPVARKLGYAI